MYTVTWEETPKTRGTAAASQNRNRSFNTEEDARKFARSLRDDVWSWKSCVAVHFDGRLVATGYDESKPL